MLGIERRGDNLRNERERGTNLCEGGRGREVVIGGARGETEICVRERE